MTNYVVTTRNKAGELEERAYTANDRADLFKQLAADGITAVRIAEGVPGKKPRKASSGGGAKIPLKTVGLVAASLVAFIAAVVIIMSLTRESPTQEPADKKEVQEENSAEPVQNVQQVVSEVTETVDKKVVDPKMRELQDKFKNLTPGDRRELAVSIMKDRELDLTPTTNKPFRTTTELHLARIFTTELGERPPPPIPKIPLQDEVHLEQILLAENPIVEGDSEKIKEGKQMLALAKAELRQYIKEGGDAESFIQYYYGKLMSAYQDRQGCLKEVLKVAAEEPEIVGEFYRQTNKSLEEKGIKRLVFPEHVKTRLGLED